MSWRPLSRRGQADPTLDEPYEGVPAHLARPVMEWLASVFWQRELDRSPSTRALKDLQLRFRLTPPLDFSTPVDAMNDLLDRVQRDQEFGLDVVDYTLHHLYEILGDYQYADTAAWDFDATLTKGGSAWEVTTRSEWVSYGLTRRAIGPVREVVLGLEPATRAHQHLVTSWNKLSGRNPDPSGSYRESVRAIEAAAKPIVLPDARRATLGTMIAALRDKPEKWRFVLGDVERVRDMCAAVWTSQLDRHGTDDESVPLNVSQEQADAAFHMALALVRIFAGRLITPVNSDA